jgi:hypothetical protein
MTAWIINYAWTVVGSIYLPRLREALTRRAADDDIDMLRANESFQFLRHELSEVTLQRVRHVGKVGFEYPHSLGIEVDCSEALKFGSFHAETKTAASAKEIYKSAFQIRNINGSWLSLKVN